MNKAKPFCIAKREVWEAYKQVRANRGAAGVDGQSIEDFERDLSNNLYRIWNRMSSGSYFPPPVRRVDIPKGDSGKTRPLGIPAVADRIAQTVVKRYLEPILEPKFHKDSYGYRPGKSAHDALAVARQRCWQRDWVLDLDIESFFDRIDWELLMRAVRHHMDCKWVLLYIERWLKAPVSMPDGTLVSRERGTPQGSVISPVLANLFLHYAFDRWMQRNTRTSRSSDTLMMLSAIVGARRRRRNYARRWNRGLRNAGFNYIRKRPRSFTARMQIVPEPILSVPSTFWAIRLGRDHRETVMGDILSTCKLCAQALKSKLSTSVSTVPRKLKPSRRFCRYRPLLTQGYRAYLLCQSRALRYQGLASISARRFTASGVISSLSKLKCSRNLAGLLCTQSR